MDGVGGGVGGISIPNMRAVGGGAYREQEKDMLALTRKQFSTLSALTPRLQPTTSTSTSPADHGLKTGAAWRRLEA